MASGPDHIVVSALPFSILLIVCISAAISDLRSRRIPNPLVLAGVVAALIWHAVAQPGSWPFDPEQPGGVGFIGSLCAGSALLMAFLPLYALGFMGAGDVKLLAFVGCVYGASWGHWTHLPAVALAVLIAGGVLAIVRMSMLGKVGLVFANLKIIMFSIMVGGVSRSKGEFFDPATDTADRMPYAFAIGLGSVGYAALSALGWRFPVPF